MRRAPARSVRNRCWPAGPANLANRRANSPGLGLAERELGGDFAHGQQRSGRGGALGQHRVGQHPDLLALHLAVLELAQAVLQPLQFPTTFRYATGSCSDAKNSSR